MDRSLAERLIGAALLVVAGVLLIPLFLDTPLSGDVDQPVQLIPAPGQPAGTQIVHVSLNGDTPPRPTAPVQNNVPPADLPLDSGLVNPPVTSPPPQQQPSQPAAPPTVTASTPLTGPGWAVQVASFGVLANAQRLADELQARQYQSFIVTTTSGTLHQVRIGPVENRDQADALVRLAVADGYRDAYALAVP